MKKLTWINGNKARIETGHKTFDRQCEILTYGNVIGTCQFSWYIRPRSELECNGRVNPPGHLQDFDLGNFKNLPGHIRDFIKTQPKTVVLYELRHWKRPGEKIVHGYVLTAGHEENYKFLRSFMVNRTNKAYAIVNWCKDYISNP